eukprot:324670-Alexandrium_andersonii.AAC.1
MHQHLGPAPFEPPHTHTHCDSAFAAGWCSRPQMLASEALNGKFEQGAVNRDREVAPTLSQLPRLWAAEAAA